MTIANLTPAWTLQMKMLQMKKTNCYTPLGLTDKWWWNCNILELKDISLVFLRIYGVGGWSFAGTGSPCFIHMLKLLHDSKQCLFMPISRRYERLYALLIRLLRLLEKAWKLVEFEQKHLLCCLKNLTLDESLFVMLRGQVWHVYSSKWRHLTKIHSRLKVGSDAVKKVL